MKYAFILCILILYICGCQQNEKLTKLLNEQKLLKDSANEMSEKIGDYLQRRVYDSAELQKKQLGAIHARLRSIQLSMDRFEKMK